MRKMTAHNYRISVTKKFTFASGYGYYAEVSDSHEFHLWLLNPVAHTYPQKGHGFNKKNPLTAIRSAITDLKEKHKTHHIL